jgi:signal transduction histidine kinase
MKNRPEVLATCLFLAIGALWIVFSSALVRSFAAERLELAAGLLSLVLTAAGVFFIVRLTTRASRRHTAELERRIAERTEELEIRNRDLAAFSYSISHDLRAPVRAVAGFSEIISTRYGESLPEEARHYLDSITTAGERMNRLIDDLLRYARLGSTTRELEDLSLTPVVNEITTEFEPELVRVSGTLHASIGDIRVRAERSLLEQIVVNLVQNAIRYRASGRALEIWIRASRIDGRVELSVTDNAIGIAPEHHERIFSLFQRLQTDDYEGTGIGLALARRAAELLGGSLTVRSAPGQGSTFVLTLQETRQ